MKTLVTVLALATVVASPAFAQAPGPSGRVVVGTKYVGQDPDAAIRSQLMRDYSTHAGGGAE